MGSEPSHLERKFATYRRALEASKESAYGESGCKRPADRAVDFELRRNGRIWRGKFVVIVLPGRYLSDAASF